MSETETPIPVAAPAGPEPAPAPSPIQPPTTPPGRRVLSALFLLGFAAAATYLVWQASRPSDAEHDSAAAERAQLRQRVEALTRSGEQARRDSDTLRARLDDSARVNDSLREQLLALGERARLVEDAVASLADRRLSGHDAMLLNEAEMLLALGAQRYTLFHDASGTIDAYRLADTALAAVDDAAFSTVRQSISAEIDALDGAADGAAALGDLAQLRRGAAQLPEAPRRLEPAAAASGWMRVFAPFVRVRHGEDAAALTPLHEAALARALFALDLREAEAAVLARDEARFRAALADARRVLSADFDATAAPVAGALGMIDTLASVQLAPAPPELFGAALKELRNLRATHALREPARRPATAQSAENHS
jgi:uroporphyrin-3 C-methyltransferase